MLIAEFTFKKPVKLFETNDTYTGVQICLNEYINEYTSHVGGMYLISNSGQVGLGEFNYWGDDECVNYILNQTNAGNIESIHVPKEAREWAYSSLRLKKTIC